ncbi:hypothetical protein CEXT_230231 [Caerostris extrusa]|uniref:Uncharacterized protein n=1 Tax=Caerostris extrusa TaxID=172846 RepID=A0AAV4NTA1_CAEEX|nr:hypothetical protein CEXT_230231 [Caerostris extrusa]
MAENNLSFLLILSTDSFCTPNIDTDLVQTAILQKLLDAVQFNSPPFPHPTPLDFPYPLPNTPEALLAFEIAVLFKKETRSSRRYWHVAISEKHNLQFCFLSKKKGPNVPRIEARYRPLDGFGTIKILDMDNPPIELLKMQTLRCKFFGVARGINMLFHVAIWLC